MLLQERQAKVRQLTKMHPEYRQLLYRRGYLLTNTKKLRLSEYPFYNQWRRESFGQLEGAEVSLLVHEDQKYFVQEWDDNHVCLIGHAYNPFTMELSEENILSSLVDAWGQGNEAFLSQVSELTGTFIIILRVKDSLFAVQDASGYKACFFGRVSEDVFVTSHPQVVADIKGLTPDPFIMDLVQTRMYNVGNRYLPGNLSAFSELKRLGPNTHLELREDIFKVQRFFPTLPVFPVTSREGIDETVSYLSQILGQSIEAITKKWRTPAISLTGGTDSKTTLAAASPYYDRLKFFSFESKPSERVDAEAAASICDSLGLTHTLYTIPPSNDDIVDFANHKAVIEHNASYVKDMADNEYRKMIALEKLKDFDVEIKSWSSEIARVFMERKYAVKFPARLSPRHFSIFQTRFMGTPRLLHQTDRIYADFLQEVEFHAASEHIEAADLYYWEMRMGAWGSAVVTAFDYCHEVTIPYNNRAFLAKFLTLPREMRKSDAAHLAIMAQTEPRVSASAAAVENPYSKTHRQMLEKVYYKCRMVGYSLKNLLLGARSK